MIEEKIAYTHTGTLHLGEKEIKCYVLENGQRVISGRSITAALGMKGRGSGVARITNNRLIKLYEDLPEIADLKHKLENPIVVDGRGLKDAHCVEGSTLNAICDLYLRARQQGNLATDKEILYAEQAELLVRGFAKVGIIALIDEVTGYQEDRARTALEQILDTFLQDHRRVWAKTFDDAFYQEMFRLKGWKYEPWNVKRPGVVGKYTTNIVYERLAPGINEKLQELNPVQDNGQRKHKHFQYLTENEGYQSLKQHLAAVTALMKASHDWSQFMRTLERVFPRFDDSLELPFDD